MKISDIRITKRYDNTGYNCEVCIDGEFQSMKLKLDDEHTQRVIDVVADLIVEASQQVAENLTRQALDHKALEYKAAG